MKKINEIGKVYNIGFVDKKNYTGIEKTYNVVFKAEKLIFQFTCTDFVIKDTLKKLIEENKDAFCIILQPTKFNLILNNENRVKVQKEIQKDLLKEYANITSIDLAFLSSNVYDLCCLKAHNISDDEVAEYISYKNRQYGKFITYNDNDLIDIKALEKIKEKYLEILKNIKA